ncbi:hypothetical protein GG344DRAFT_68248 [Lentinula edodes]|nr:hypothetical protein GG344DRAFT_68248 [Lentinula edodes]
MHLKVIFQYIISNTVEPQELQPSSDKTQSFKFSSHLEELLNIHIPFLNLCIQLEKSGKTKKRPAGFFRNARRGSQTLLQKFEPMAHLSSGLKLRILHYIPKILPAASISRAQPLFDRTAYLCSLSYLCWSKNVSDPRHYPWFHMRINSLIVLVLASGIVRALPTSDTRPKTGGIRKTSQKSGSQVCPNARLKKKVTFKDPFRGQTLYIMLESETMAPEHDEDSKEANKQIVQFLHYPDIWEALNLSKYQKPNSEGPHSNDALQRIQKTLSVA